MAVFLWCQVELLNRKTAVAECVIGGSALQRACGVGIAVYAGADTDAINGCF